MRIVERCLFHLLAVNGKFLSLIFFRRKLFELVLTNGIYSVITSMPEVMIILIDIFFYIALFSN